MLGSAPARKERRRNGASRSAYRTRLEKTTENWLLLFGTVVAVGQGMKLEEAKYDNSETGCCARLDTEFWDGRDFEWKDQLFLKTHVRAFLHIPLNFGSVMGRAHAKVREAEAYPERPLWLTDEVSAWGSDVYLELDREIPGSQTARLSGRFLTKVFEGPFRAAGEWAKAMQEHVIAKGEQLKKLYFYYATCPKCAKRFGKNQVVLFAQV